MAEDIRLAEAAARQLRDNISGAFAARAALFQALNIKRNAEALATMAAPEGCLWRIEALADDTLETILDSHKKHPIRLKQKAGTVVYAPRIESTRPDGYATITATSWVNGPLGDAFRFDGHNPVIINNDQFALDVMSQDEFADLRQGPDYRSLYAARYAVATATV